MPSFAEEIEDAIKSKRSMLITWVNHFSALQNMNANTHLAGFDLVGVDGLFLKKLLRISAERSSADLILPDVLERTNCSVALIGGRNEDLSKRVIAFSETFSHNRVLWALDGFGGSEDLRGCQLLSSSPPELVIVGAGAVAQETIALSLKEVAEQNGCVIVTCGGWLDQIAFRDYYPKWAYPMRLNWLVRLAREPRRLWRRYSTYAFTAILHRADLRAYLPKIS